MSNAEVFYKNYWGKLVSILENFENEEDFKLSNPTKTNWYQIRLGHSDVWIELVSSIKYGEIQAQLRMRYDDNLFEKLFNQKEEIESETDLDLEWIQTGETSYIRVLKENVDFSNQEDLKEALLWHALMSVKLYNLFKDKL